MTYAVDGTEIALQPTTGRWIPRQAVGIDGNGHPVYPGVREFELTWILSDPSDFNELQGYFDGLGTTGTAVVDLPQYGAATYTFFSYSGCVLREPEMGSYFTQNHQNVRLLITNIST